MLEGQGQPDETALNGSDEHDVIEDVDPQFTIQHKICMFDEKDFVGYFMEKKGIRTMCCGLTCFRKLREDPFRPHEMLLGFMKTLKPPDILNRTHRMFVMPCLMSHANPNGSISQYRIVSISHKPCQTLWLQLFIIPSRTFLNWRLMIGQSQNILPVDHGFVVRVSNTFTDPARDAVCEYIDTVVSVDG